MSPVDVVTEPRQRERIIDRYLQTYDVRSSHAVEVDAPPAITYRAARELDIGRSLPIAVLFALRGLPHLVTGKARLSRSLTLETLLQMGFRILDERPPEEFVMGTVGRFWRPDSGLVPIAPEEFAGFDEPGFAKGVMSFAVEPHETGSLLTTETRVSCTDPSALRKFSLYWRLIEPFSGLIRRQMLDQVRRTAERT